jgi:hypothetical protein
MALKKRHSVSLRALALSLGEPENFSGTLSDMLRRKPGAASLATENRVRAALGLAPLARRAYLRPCLSLDPAVRAAQLRRLLAAAEAASTHNHPKE